MTPALLVLAGGPLTTVQDLGRPGWLRVGVGVGGAADRGAHRLANRLVGNDETAATLECLLGGLTFEASGAVSLAVTGARAPVSVDGTAAGHASVLDIADGQRVALGVPTAGLRSYVAVRGGIDAVAVLGSRSRHTLAGLGPDPVTGGDVLPVGTSSGPWPGVDTAPVPAPTRGTVRARVVPGPRDDWFVDATALWTGAWQVSSQSDRVGVRLDRVGPGPALTRSRTGELPTEGVPLGAVQVPPSGQPVVFLADHPVTGGYPVVATVVDADVDLLAQARPAQRVVFEPIRATGRRRLLGPPGPGT